jgi:Ca2+-binding EF-hand superfamily protein
MLRAAFDRLDLDRNGFLDLEELTRAVTRLPGCRAPSDLLEVLIDLDGDGDARVSFEEFLAFMRVEDDCWVA